MTFAEFKRKWSRYQGKETSAYQSHFDDLCRVLGRPTPNEADPSGADFFCCQKRVVKDAELFDVETSDASEPDERGFADVWKKSCFGWEYKGKKKNLDEAYKQLLGYRESLLNPPLLVVCDFDRYIVKTNFNGMVAQPYQIGRPPRQGSQKIQRYLATGVFCSHINRACRDKIRLHTVIDQDKVARISIVQQVTEHHKQGPLHRFEFYAGEDFYTEIYLNGHEQFGLKCKVVWVGVLGCGFRGRLF